LRGASSCEKWKWMCWVGVDCAVVVAFGDVVGIGLRVAFWNETVMIDWLYTLELGYIDVVIYT
jgi:hypothetical protein